MTSLKSLWESLFKYCFSCLIGSAPMRSDEPSWRTRTRTPRLHISTLISWPSSGLYPKRRQKHTLKSLTGIHKSEKGFVKRAFSVHYALKHYATAHHVTWCQNRSCLCFGHHISRSKSSPVAIDGPQMLLFSPPLHSTGHSAPPSAILEIPSLQSTLEGQRLLNCLDIGSYCGRRIAGVIGLWCSGSLIINITVTFLILIDSQNKISLTEIR